MRERDAWREDALVRGVLELHERERCLEGDALARGVLEFYERGRCLEGGRISERSAGVL